KPGRTMQAVLLGGAAGSFVTAAQLDVPLTFEGTRAIGATLGSGAVIVFDDTADMKGILLRIARFFRDEACGQCVPCRVGTKRQEGNLERLQVDTPALCQLENLRPVNACRVCVVELEGSRVLVPACSRKVEAGMKVATDSERVRHSRRLVLELLASSVDMSLTSPQVHGWMARYGATPARFGSNAATVAQPVKVDNDLYVRDYSRCIL